MARAAAPSVVLAVASKRLGKLLSPVGVAWKDQRCTDERYFNGEDELWQLSKKEGRKEGDS